MARLTGPSAAKRVDIRERRADLQAAIRRAKPGDVLSLSDLTLIWGTTKGAFVNVQRQMNDFPAPTKAGNEHVYPAKPALQAMLAHETRHDEAARLRKRRTDAILGIKAGGRDAQSDSDLPPNQMAILARMAADTEQRERDQGLYVPVAEAARVAGEVFGEISEFMRGLPNALDPHGQLPPMTRAAIADKASELLLQLNRRMRDVLSPDAKPAGNRKPTRRAGTPRTRR